MLVDYDALRFAQEKSDTTMAQEILNDAFLTDVRPLVRQVRLEKESALYPLEVYRQLKVREKLIDNRGFGSATGL